MFAVNVQNVSVQQLNAYITIRRFTQTSNSFAVVNLVTDFKRKQTVKITLRDVLM